MPRQYVVDVRSYRGHRLEVQDDGGDGWRVVVHAPRGARVPSVETLRNSVPGGLGELLGEARRRVDRRLDGEPGAYR